jgi:hypothetical protein
VRADKITTSKAALTRLPASTDPDRCPGGRNGELGGREDTTQKLRAAIEAAGVEFIDENGGGLGVRLRKPKKEKQPRR